jgi:hypothetical protein
MAGEKEFPLSITIRTVDKATSGIKRINDQLDKSFGPLRKLGKEFGRLGENMGLSKISAGVRGIGGMFTKLAGQVGMAAGVVGVAAFGFKKLVDEADDLGDAAEKVGLTVDALAQLRFAAKLSGSSVEELDAGLGTFTKGLGQARAGTGKLTGFLKKVSPALLKQLKGAKSNEEAFGLMAQAMDQIEDPGKRAALATAAFGGAGVGLAPLLARGAAGIDELRQRYAKLAGPQGDAAEKAGAVKDALDDLGAATDSVKASLLVGLGPAFKQVTEKVTAFLTGHREQIGTWVSDFGEKLPGRIAKLSEVLGGLWRMLETVVGVLGKMVDWVGGSENAVKLLIVAFAGFKALALVGHLGGIASGLMGVATAALKAGSAMAGAEAAAAAAEGAGAAAGGAGAAVGAGGFAGLAGAAAALTAVFLAAKLSADTILGDQERAFASQERGAIVNADLEDVRKKPDANSRRRLDQSLRQGGFIDPTTGRVERTPENVAALGGGDTLDVHAQIEAWKKITELNRMLAERPTLGAANLGAQKPAKTEVKVAFENAPKGTRVTGTGMGADLSLAVGFAMLAP